MPDLLLAVVLVIESHVDSFGDSSLLLNVKKFKTRCKKGNFCTLCNFGETLDCMASSGPLHFVTTPIAAQLIGTLWSPRNMEVKI